VVGAVVAVVVVVGAVGAVAVVVVVGGVVGGVVVVAVGGGVVTLAALDNHQLEVARQGRFPVDELLYEDAGALFDSMAERGISTLTIHRSALGPVLPLPAELKQLAPGERRAAHPWLDRGDVDHRSLAPALKRGALEVLIGAYQSGVGDPFADAGNARTLLCAHQAFADALDGWDFRHSAAATGWALMHAPWTYGRRKQRRQRLLDEGAHFPPIGEPRQHEVPWGAWRSGVDPRRAYIHGYDIHGQRLAACARLRLGAGKPFHLDATTDLARIRMRLKQPGYHKVRLSQPWTGVKLPVPFEDGWHTTPRLAILADGGVRFSIESSWVYPESVVYLDPFYESIRDGRNTLIENHNRPGALIALGALKQCYLQPLGRLSSAREGERGSVWFRPDWYDAVIGRELGLQWLRMQRLEALVQLAAVYYDTLLIESDDPDSLTAGIEAGLPLHTHQLGKFRPLARKGAPSGQVWEHLQHGAVAYAVQIVKEQEGFT
jgi:hypothetical protein